MEWGLGNYSKSWMGSHFPATLRKGHECLDSYLFFPHTWTWFHLREKKMPKTGSYFSIWEQLAFVCIQNLTSGTSFGHVAIYLLGFILVENLVCLRHCVRLLAYKCEGSGRGKYVTPVWALMTSDMVTSPLSYQPYWPCSSCMWPC